ncbi:MAG: bifunctional tetrahydrofolate synthase/dihydrofolate synthase [Rubrivivax sp.]
MPGAARTLADWLAHCERLHPTAIELGLDRVRAVQQRLGIRFDDAAVIVVAGTNGKGSTCALAESIALQGGWRVGLYSKPHLVHFEERCRIGGVPLEAAALVPHFEAVEQARQGVTLTYFEFTTLAILRALSQAPLDLVILEVGLGGRLDAVNVIDADVSVITSVDVDHVEYLGTDREAIGREKAHVMRPGRPAIIGDPLPPESVLAYAAAIGADVRLAGRDFHHAGDRQQWRWSGRGRRYAGLAYPALRGVNQLLNASAAIAALEVLRDRLPITAQAVRQGLALVQLPGRFQIVPGQPVIVLDVAHNAQAVAVLAQNLDAMGFFPRTRAVFGAMRDKALPELIARLQPLVDHWHFCDLPTARAARAAELDAIERPATPGRRVDTSTHADPSAALRAAFDASHPTDRIVVFGSFYTVGGVLAAGLPRVAGPPASPAAG